MKIEMKFTSVDNFMVHYCNHLVCFKKAVYLVKQYVNNICESELYLCKEHSMRYLGEKLYCG